MKLLTQTKHSDVVYILKDTNYPKVYAKLSQILDDNDLRFFSSVEMRQMESRWSANFDGDFVKYPQLSEDGKELVADEIQYLKTNIREKISTDPQLAPYIDDILNVPDEDRIFVCFDEVGLPKVTLAEWGCTKYKSKRDFNPLGRIVEQPKKNHTQVDVHIAYSDGSVYAQRPVFFFYKDRVRQMDTDEKGLIRLGLLKNDSEFTLSPSSEITSFAHTIKVTAGQTSYQVIFPYFTSANVKVIDQLNQSVINVEINVTSSDMEKIFTTDGDGAFVIENIVLDNIPLKLSLSSNTGISQAYLLKKEGNDLIFKITRIIKRNPVILVVNRKNKEIVADYMLKINIEESERELKSNADGLIILGEQKLNTKIIVTDTNSAYNYMEFVVTIEDNIWQFPVDFPEEKFVRVKLLNVKGKFIPNHPIDIIIQGKVYSRTTDVEGYVILPENLFKHGEKVKVEIPLLESDLKKK
jgi:hypothetical protein